MSGLPHFAPSPASSVVAYSAFWAHTRRTGLVGGWAASLQRCHRALPPGDPGPFRCSRYVPLLRCLWAFWSFRSDRIHPPNFDP